MSFFLTLINKFVPINLNKKQDGKTKRIKKQSINFKSRG